MSRGTPEADDFTFVLESIDGVKYDAYIEMLVGASPEHIEIDCRTREVGSTGKWSWLAGYDVYGVDKLVGVQCDEAAKEAINFIQEAIKKVFGGEKPPKPSSGRERIDYIIKNELHEEGNTLFIKEVK